MKQRTIFCRIWQHLISPPWIVKRYFTEQSLLVIEQAIAESERKHGGEIRFAVESSLTFHEIWSKKSAKKRAIEVFSDLHIWDTEQNNGVLIYFLLADRDFEIVVDRGIHQHVSDSHWQAICQRMEALFRQKQFEVGVLLGIEEISRVLQQYYPVQPRNLNELSNKPVIL